jgi:hypothetical protein
VRLREHRHNFKEGLLEKSKLAQHAYEEGHRIGWDEVRVLEIESNGRYRKYKELAHMACLTNPISQPSLDENRASFRNVVFSITRRWTQSKNLVILSVTHHRQNHSEPTGTKYMTRIGNRKVT